MSFPLPRSILASTSFRLTMVYATLFVIVTLTVLFLVGTAAMLWLKAELKDDVVVEIQDLEAVFEAQGSSGLAAVIAARKSESAESGVFYLLAGATREPLAGNLELSDFASGWFEFVPLGEEDDEVYLARAVQLPDGSWLVVAIDLEPVLDTWELMLAGIGWTLGISFPLALLCGAMMSVMVLRRIASLNETTRRIREIGIDQRAPLRGTNDEFDHLTSHINAMLDSIETLTRNIHEVSSGIAHDLRTPLTRVSNRLHGLQGRELMGEELEREVEAGLAEIGAVLETFDALLRIGEIEAGTRRAGFRQLDFSALVVELAETYEVMASANDKNLRSEIAPGVQLQGDRALLVQMIANVLDNAIVHTPSGTEISIALAPGREAAQLVIADNGPGVPQEDLRRVFTRFYRVDRSRSTNGNGLGMSIVRSIANLHGIEVTIADNAPGLRVVFALPPLQRQA